MKEVFIMVKTDDDYKEKVRSIAKSKGMNISEYIRYLIARDEERKEGK